MIQLIKDFIARLEHAEEPSQAIDVEIVQLTRLPYKGYSRSLDAALEMSVVAPGWYIEHAGDNAMGEVGNLRVFGHTVELSNGIKTVQGDAPTKPLAYCLAFLKAYQSDWEAAEGRLNAMLAADTRVSSAVMSDITAVISNVVVPFPLPEAEIDEDDHSVILRWTLDERSVSLTFLGHGFVTGYLIDPLNKGPSFRCEVRDSSRIGSKLNRESVLRVISPRSLGTLQ
jgi:hypothetical protein